MALNRVISNILSLGANLLPFITASAQASSSSSSPPAESHQIEVDLESLTKVLKRIKATVHDAEEREIKDEATKLWLRELKGVAYDLEDVLDEYHYEVLRVQVEARHASALNPHKGMEQVQLPDGMSDQMKKIKGRFDEICTDREVLRLSEEDGRRRCNSEGRITPTGPFVVESDIFGYEREKEELIDLLSPECHDDNVVSVVTVVGQGGVGKTTLAQLAYNNQRIRQRFSKFGWVCVSVDFNVQRLMRESIESITGIECKLTNLGALQRKISEEIKEERVLLVLDDVWNENVCQWDSLRAPFTSAALVRILVTTRNEFVARIVQTVPTFNLSCLSEDHSWLLFEHHAFGRVNGYDDSKLVEVGKEIIKKCGRLPLAIKSIASLLRHEPEEENWKDVLESELWESDASNQIFAPLQISYTRLPTHLKPCFLYCSMFPKDYHYTEEELVALWISQGYIESTGKRNTEKIGREYVKQLRHRSFFEDHSSYLKLHDMVHDLARHNSENGCYSIEAGKVPIFPEKLYHLYVAYDVELVEPLPASFFTSLRTVVGFGAINFFSTIGFSKAQNLRALELKGADCEFEYFSSIINLKHLRYLSLEDLPLEMLPECICSLYHLRYLTLVECYNLSTLPKSIENLVSLEELVISGCELQVLPVSFCQLKALTKLCLLRCYKFRELPNDLGSLTNLQTLKIQCTKLSVLPVSFCQLKALSELRLYQCDELVELPNDIGSLTNLQTLEIEGSKLRVLPVSFCQLKALSKLRLYQCDELVELPNDIGSLTNLQTLKIQCTKLRVLPVSFCQLKALSQLQLFQCRELEELPNDIGSLTNLQTLEIASTKLRVLPVSFCQLKALSELLLYRCYQLVELPNDIGSLTNLQTLKIRGTKLRVLPVSFCQLKALSELRLSECDELEELPNDIGSLTNLQTLEIRLISNFRSFQPNFSKFAGIQIFNVQLNWETIGWLKDFVNLKGTLCLENLHRVHCLTDVQCDKLVSMHNLEHLMLCWRGLYSQPGFCMDKGNVLWLRIKSQRNTLPNERGDFPLLDRLQPHQNLRELYIAGYDGVEFPRWICYPTSRALLERFVIKWCRNLTFLPFGRWYKLKYLTIDRCFSLRFLLAESLPSELQELNIFHCNNLTYAPGIQKLKSLVELDIRYCESLNSLVSGTVPSIELTSCTNESLWGLRNLTSLRSLRFDHCLGLQPREVELLHVETCKVEVFHCPSLKEWCSQQSIPYEECLWDYCPS